MPGSANFEILREKTFSCVFDYDAECPKLICGLSIGHSRRQTIPMWNSSRGYGWNSSGHHCMSGIYNIEQYVLTW